jgi:hypothetical protein
MNIILITILVLLLLALFWSLFSSVEATKPELEKEEKTPEKIEDPEKIFRRRASDRAIEKEYPDEALAPAHEERESASGEKFPFHEDSSTFSLPFPANDIITDRSKFRLYKRTLLNSEAYARKGDIETAISLFKGVRDRILDKDVRDKINANIEYLNRFRQRREEDFKKRVESKLQESQGGELKVKIEGQLPSTINISIPEKSLQTESIAEKISEDISKNLNSLKEEIDRLKSTPEDKSGIKDSEEFKSLQNELRELKEKFIQISSERDKILNELSRIREIKEEEVSKRELEKENALLNEIKNEIEKLTKLKDSIEKLQNKIDEIEPIKIPEAQIEPKIIEARYQSPIPVQFDPKPVIDILEKFNEIKEKQIEEQKQDISQTEEIEDLEEPKKPEEIIEEIVPEEKKETPEEIIQEEASELLQEELPEEILTEEEIVRVVEEKPEELQEEILQEPAVEEEIFPEKSQPHETEESTQKEEELKLEPEQQEAQVPTEEKISEKEKELLKEAQEDPNDFELLSEYGKPKDDSTLTDEEIFEKILKDDKKKQDDSQFEILGDKRQEDSEISLSESLDDKKRDELEFYKKFITPDRIKKKELPILKVSFDFKKLPDEFSLSREKNILEYSFYKYKPLLQKADEFVQQRRVKDAINYYKVVADQNIPVEFKAMIRRNIKDLTEYIEKYLSSD